LQVRMGYSRLTRVVNAFCRKIENRKAALALHVAHYYLVRVQGSLRVTPAMAARLMDRIWNLDDLLPY